MIKATSYNDQFVLTRLYFSFLTLPIFFYQPAYNPVYPLGGHTCVCPAGVRISPHLPFMFPLHGHPFVLLCCQCDHVTSCFSLNPYYYLLGLSQSSWLHSSLIFPPLSQPLSYNSTTQTCQVIFCLHVYRICLECPSKKKSYINQMYFLCTTKTDFLFPIYSSPCFHSPYAYHDDGNYIRVIGGSALSLDCTFQGQVVSHIVFGSSLLNTLSHS